MLDALHEYCLQNKLTLNTSKTKVVIFQKGGSNFRNINFHFGGENIEIEKDYTCLGISFSKKGLWNLAAERAVQKASIASASTLRVIRILSRELK